MSGKKSLVFLGLFFSTLPMSAYADGVVPAVNQFADMLTGLFDSSSQAIDDSEYLDVSVRHCSVMVTDLPADKRDGRFLALRQSVSTDAKPYRVRILRVFAGVSEETVRVSSFALNDNSDISELCFKPEAERIISFSQLAEEKCTTESRLQNSTFVGGTVGDGCPSSRAGAVRMTSELTLDAQGMTTWDRGWTAQGQLAWGPEKGPYIFERVTKQ
ncbi:MAG: hypothetical protein RL189_13, partial [Pseudomonadota bacterium]